MRRRDYIRRIEISYQSVPDLGDNGGGGKFVVKTDMS